MGTLGATLLLHLALRACANIASETVNLQFVNNADQSGSLFFVPDKGENSFLWTLGANGGTFKQDSYVTHRFEFDVEGLKPVVVKAMSTGTITFDVSDGELRATGTATRGERINVKFVNNAERSGSLFFVSDKGENSFLGTLKALFGTDTQDSYVTHRFEFDVEGLKPVVVAAMSTGTITFDVRDGELRATGTALTRPDHYKGPKWETFTEKLRKQCFERFAGGSSSDAAYFCDRRHDKRTFVTAQFDNTDEEAARRMGKQQGERMEETRLQPTWYHNFTDLGFSVSDIPADLYAKLRSFHSSQRLTSKPEIIAWDDPNLSGRESDTWLADLPQNLKHETSEMLKRAIASWSGVPVEDLERTAFFGIRLYHKGSVLNMHVDRKETHVLSAILEIGRADASDDEPWPLKIVDHAGEVHLIPSREGQLILYESATCPHGRDEPLQGREVANCFAHFAPRGWPDGYQVRAEL